MTVRPAIALALVGAVALAACAPTSRFPTVDPAVAEAEARKQRVAALETQLRRNGRLQNTAFPILVAGAELCGDAVAPRLGLGTVTLEHYGREWRETSRTHFGIGDRLTVLFVVKGSPAEAAGLERGDKILRFDGKPLGTGKRAFQEYDRLLRKRGIGNVELVFEREGASRTVFVEAVAACDYPVLLVHRGDVNAWADGKNVYVTTGMLRFSETDHELALIVGHELAHNTRGHVAAKQGNILIGAIVGALITGATGVDVTDLGAQMGAAAFSQDFEAEADYVGVYLAARAGFDVTQAASFWRRMGAEHPAAIHLAGSTHPSTAMRFLAVESAIEEIATKRTGGRPLIPEEARAVATP